MNKTIIKIAILSALATQVNHAAFVFASISKMNVQWINEILSYVFAISLELSIYIFTFSNRKKTALVFAFISIAINLLYYQNINFSSFSFYAAIVVSVIVPITIYHYSDLINQQQKTTAPEPTTNHLPQPTKILV